jgi:hypothetical protein
MYCALAGYYLKLFYKICFINLDPSSDLHADVMSLESTRHQPREAPAPMWAASNPAGGEMSLSDGKGRTARKAMTVAPRSFGHCSESGATILAL